MSWWIYVWRGIMTADTGLSYERSSRLIASKSTHGFITQPEHDYISPIDVLRGTGLKISEVIEEYERRYIAEHNLRG